jgi:hypothetical protein
MRSRPGSPHQFRVRLARPGDHEGIAGLATRRDVERRRGVAHAAGDHALARCAVPIFAIGRACGNARARGTQPEQAATGGGNANGAAAVIACRHRYDARRDRGCGAAAGAAGRVIGIPGIAGAAEQLRVRHALERKFRQIGLAENHEPGLEIAPHHMGMFAGNSALHRPAAIGRRQAGIVLRAILDQEGYAGERAGKLLLQLGAGFALHQAADRIRHRVGRRALPERDVEQFRRGCLAAGNAFGEADRVALQIFA